MTNFACDKPCKYCTVVKRCPRIRQPETLGKTLRERKWNPNDGSEDATLKCDDTIPWPVIQAFGQHIHGRVWCSEHGWQPRLTKAQVEKTRQAARKAAKMAGNDELPSF